MTDTGHDDDLLMSHSYDGISEYDNPMPGWWVWTFVATVIFCVPYFMWYHLGAGPSIWDKHEAEVASYGEFLLAKYGELEANEETILSLTEDDAAMKSMDSVFKAKCAQCHAADGGGQVGPNLTDEWWINVTNVADIAEVVMNGRPAKGMSAWKDHLTETQIVLLSAYVAQLQQHRVLPPDGKEPQGEHIEPWQLPIAMDLDETIE